MQDYMTPNEVYRSAEYGKRLAERIKPINGGQFEIADKYGRRNIDDWLFLQLQDKQKPKALT